MGNHLASLSIVLPAYNEEAVIADTVRHVITQGEKYGCAFEIIVVNDGSRDNTPRIVEDLCTHDARIRVVHHNINKGYGEALRSGFATATKEWIFLMDADGQFDMTNLEEFFPHTDTHDMLLGYREKRADTPLRVLLGWGYTTCMNVLFAMRFKDIDCAFKLFRRSAWKAVQPITSTDHKIFSTEWLWKSAQRKLRIKELPIPHYPRRAGVSTGAKPDIIWEMFKALIKLRFR